ncbi:hypothetical protein MSIMFI_05587 [Mycobacterium simulans]|nr:hypothetical protein MSIMFI_05587 [Mycobacterium simulans]
MIEHQGRWQGYAGFGGQRVAQFKAGQGIDAKVFELPVAVQRPRVGMREHGRRRGFH